MTWFVSTIFKSSISSSYLHQILSSASKLLSISRAPDGDGLWPFRVCQVVGEKGGQKEGRIS